MAPWPGAAGTYRPHRSQGSRPDIVVQVDRLELKGDRRVIEGLRVTGHDERVVEVVKTILQGGPAKK